MKPTRACLLLASLAAAGVAQAQSAAPKDDSSLTWNGITLYGIVDLGLQYITHGLPISDYFPAGTYPGPNKLNNASVTGVTPSNLSQSRIGLSGLEPIPGTDLAGVFRMETFFNPQSGNLSDGLKSLTLNNGKAAANQATGVDTSIAGQAFAGALYAGLASPTYGSLTFGRHPTPVADGIAKYDPMGASQAFSIIGLSGFTAGGGDTEDRRLDQSIKYTGKYGPVHVGALYQLNGSNGGANTAFQAQLGTDFLGGGSIDAYYFKKKDAISASSLSGPQVADIQLLGYSPSNTLAGTVSDNSSWDVMALYNFGIVKVYGGYEHIDFNNPSTPLPVGYVTIGGYVLGVVNNDAYAVEKTETVYWGGVKYNPLTALELTAAYYGYHQDAYATGADAGCNTTVSSKCSGNLNAVSLMADYRFSKRFDAYVGSMWSNVENGLANEYLNKDTIATTIGVRFKF
jgi:predicted porin